MKKLFFILSILLLLLAGCNARSGSSAEESTSGPPVPLEGVEVIDSITEEEAELFSQALDKQPPCPFEELPPRQTCFVMFSGGLFKVDDGVCVQPGDLSRPAYWAWPYGSISTSFHPCLISLPEGLK